MFGEAGTNKPSDRPNPSHLAGELTSPLSGVRMPGKGKPRPKRRTHKEGKEKDGTFNNPIVIFTRRSHKSGVNNRRTGFLVGCLPFDILAILRY